MAGLNCDDDERRKAATPARFFCVRPWAAASPLGSEILPRSERRGSAHARSLPLKLGDSLSLLFFFFFYNQPCEKPQRHPDAIGYALCSPCPCSPSFSFPSSSTSPAFAPRPLARLWGNQQPGSSVDEGKKRGTSGVGGKEKKGIYAASDGKGTIEQVFEANGPSGPKPCSENIERLASLSPPPFCLLRGLRLRGLLLTRRGGRLVGLRQWEKERRPLKPLSGGHRRFDARPRMRG